MLETLETRSQHVKETDYRCVFHSIVVLLGFSKDRPLGEAAMTWLLAVMVLPQLKHLPEHLLDTQKQKMSHWELVTDYLELNKAIEEHRK